VPYPCFFIYGTCHAHILDICLCLHIHLCIEYNHLDMHGMICTQHPTFSTFALPLRSYRANNYHLEVPYF
jgi:hypothetical protein